VHGDEEQLVVDHLARALALELLARQQLGDLPLEVSDFCNLSSVLSCGDTPTCR
jgi:hypothetical protein